MSGAPVYKHRAQVLETQAFPVGDTKMQFYISKTCFWFFFFFWTDKRIEREEEEEEEALPLDMMDEDDLQLMKNLGQRASFLTRDLSSR